MWVFCFVLSFPTHLETLSVELSRHEFHSLSLEEGRSRAEIIHFRRKGQRMGGNNWTGILDVWSCKTSREKKGGLCCM